MAKKIKSLKTARENRKKAIKKARISYGCSK